MRLLGTLLLLFGQSIEALSRKNTPETFVFFWSGAMWVPIVHFWLLAGDDVESLQASAMATLVTIICFLIWGAGKLVVRWSK